jgi:N-acetylneuraminic acid mutarotase
MNISRAGNAAAIGTDGTIYSMGGNIIADPDMTATVEAYDRLTGTWSFKAPMQTARTAFAVVTGVDGRIYAIGGCLESHGYGGTTSVEVYDPVTDAWTEVAPLQTGRTGHKAITTPDGRIYVMGGHNLPLGHLNSMEIYDPATNTWVSGPPMTVARQQFGATLGTDGKIYIIGGSDQWRSGIMDTVEIFDPATGTWTFGAPMPTPRDGVAATVGSGGLIYAMGGWTGNFPHHGDVTELVEIFDPKKNEWYPSTQMLREQYSPAAVTDSKCRIFAIGGGAYGTSALVQVFSTASTRNGSRQVCGLLR